MQHATCNMQHATSNMQHATCNMQHATCGAQSCSAACTEHQAQHTTIAGVFVLSAGADGQPQASERRAPHSPPSLPTRAPPRTHCARASAASSAILIVSPRFGVAESLSECVGYSYSVVVAPTDRTRPAGPARSPAERAPSRAARTNRTEVTPTRPAAHDTIPCRPGYGMRWGKSWPLRLRPRSKAGWPSWLGAAGRSGSGSA